MDLFASANRTLSTFHRIPNNSVVSCVKKVSVETFVYVMSLNHKTLTILEENECLNGKATCHPNATCIDTDESYICVCKPGFMDKLGLTNPGRSCEQCDSKFFLKILPDFFHFCMFLVNINDRCTKGNNDCDPNARCIPQGASDFVCVCPAGYKDKSPNIQSRPGRLCIPRKL